MGKRKLICTELSPSELRTWALSAETTRERQRGLAIAACMEGATRVAAGVQVGLEDQSVIEAINRYNAGGISTLKDKKHTGRPPKLTAERQKELCDLTVKGPDVEAEGVSAYTRADLAGVVAKKWDVTLAVTTIGRVLRDGGLSRQKARPSHPKKNTEAAVAFSKNA